MSETGPTLRDLGPFDPGLTISLRGQRMVWLTKAANEVHDARVAGIPALIAKIQTPEAREACLQAIERLPTYSRRLLILKYANKAKGR